jgi:hypothetical protein
MQAVRPQVIRDAMAHIKFISSLSHPEPLRQQNNNIGSYLAMLGQRAGSFSRFCNRSERKIAFLCHCEAFFKRPWQSQMLENRDCFPSVALRAGLLGSWQWQKNGQNSTYCPVSGCHFSYFLLQEMQI